MSHRLDNELYVIWSHEHNAFWRPKDAGYTEKLSEAGRYLRSEAIERTLNHIPIGEEVAIPESYAADAIRRRLIHGLSPDIKVEV